MQKELKSVKETMKKYENAVESKHLSDSRLPPSLIPFQTPTSVAPPPETEHIHAPNVDQPQMDPQQSFADAHVSAPSSLALIVYETLSIKSQHSTPEQTKKEPKETFYSTSRTPTFKYKRFKTTAVKKKAKYHMKNLMFDPSIVQPVPEDVPIVPTSEKITPTFVSSNLPVLLIQKRKMKIFSKLKMKKSS